MKNPIAWIIGIVLTLSLITFGILGQVSGAKDLAEKGNIEQTKLSMMLSDKNIVTGSTVKNYIKNNNVNVSIYDKNDKTKLKNDDVMDGALFKTEKIYDENGDLEKIRFQRIDLGRKDGEL